MHLVLLRIKVRLTFRWVDLYKLSGNSPTGQLAKLFTQNVTDNCQDKISFLQLTHLQIGLSANRLVTDQNYVEATGLPKQASDPPRLALSQCHVR